MSEPVKRIAKSAVLSFMLVASLLGTLAVAQVRQVDQGRAGTSTSQIWVVKVCDSNGANCNTFALSNTGTNNAIAVRCVDPTGTQFVDCGGASSAPVSVTSGTINSATISQMPSVSVTSGTIGSLPGITQTSGTVNSATISQMPSVSVTSGTIGLITMPSLTVTSGTIGSLPGVSVTSGTIGLITMPSLTVTSGTIGSLPAITGTVQANAGTGTQAVSVANGTIGQITLPVVNVGTMPTVNVGTFGPAINIGTFGPTAAVNLSQVLGVALSTANPVIKGGRGSTTIPTAVADAAVVAARLSKYGDTITQYAPYDMLGFGTTAVTATTAAQILASSGANTKWAITSIQVCNLSGVVATVMNITDSAGTLFAFPWTNTATTAGEPRCYMQQFPTPYLAATNSTMSVQLTVSNATGVRANITAYKTGT